MIFVAAAAVARHITFNPDINFWPFFHLKKTNIKCMKKITNFLITIRFDDLVDVIAN